MSNTKQVQKIREQMISIYGEGCWMGYRLTKKNPYTYHHIREARNGGKVTLEQINKYKDEYDPFAWTIALAPADDPKIAVVVVLVQGGTSYNAGPVVRDIIGEYLLNETKFDKADFTTKMQ